KDLSEAFYVSGEKVLSYRHQIAAKTEKEAAAKNLIKLYDEYDKRFPANTNGNAINKAMLLHLSGSENRSDIYKLLDAAFEKTPAQFSNADAMHLYFDIYYDKFKSGDQGITAENILQKLDELRGHIARMNSKASAQQSHVYG